MAEAGTLTSKKYAKLELYKTVSQFCLRIRFDGCDCTIMRNVMIPNITLVHFQYESKPYIS